MNDNIVLIGEKRKHLQIPDGYKKVHTGICKEGDLFANLMTYKWSPVDKEDVELKMTTDDFDVLIRKINFKTYL